MGHQNKLRHSKSKTKRITRSRSSYTDSSRSSSRSSRHKSKKSKRSSAKRSRDSSRDRSSASSRRDRKRKSNKKSSRSRRSRSSSTKKSSSPPSGPQIKLDTKEESEADIVRRQRELQSIDSSGFEQKAFKSSSIGKGSARGPEFDFGTQAEKAATVDKAKKVIERFENEDICHPDWFGDQDERNAKWLRHLSLLRQKILETNDKWS